MAYLCSILFASSQNSELDVHSSIIITYVSFEIFAVENLPSGTIFVMNRDGILPKQ